MTLLVEDFLEKTKHLPDNTPIMTNNFEIDSKYFIPKHSNTVHAIEDNNTIILAEKMGGGWIDKSDLTLGELKEIINTSEKQIEDIALDDEDRLSGCRDAFGFYVIDNVILIY